MNHLKGRSLLRKDQARRLKWQENQRIQSKAIKPSGIKLSESQLKTFASKLIK